MDLGYMYQENLVAILPTSTIEPVFSDGCNSFWYGDLIYPCATTVLF